MKEVAIQFGVTLDNDNFSETKKTLHQDCIYVIGKEVIAGPDKICESYEQNMIEGRKKLDNLEWGKSTIETINESEFYVHFTDYLTHKGQSYTHRCKQKLSIGLGQKIIRIEHIDDQDEQLRLDRFYNKVGLK